MAGYGAQCYRWRAGIGALLLGMIVVPSAAHAAFGDYGEGGWGISSSTLQDMIQADMMNRSLRALQDSVRPGSGKAAKPKSPPLSPLDVRSAMSVTGKYFTTDRGVTQLAALFPRDQFIRRKGQLSDGIIALGDRVAQAYGIPKLNLATSRAAAIAGAYAAYTGQTFPDAYVKPLVAQLDREMRVDPKILAATPSSKSYQYQLGMGVGLLLMGADLELKAKPDAGQRTQLRAIGAQTLRSMFGVEASRVTFSNKGYAVKP